ncbi:MAG: hypothetical protein AAB590_00580 [Patescibacteria group bacterium]
MKNSPKKFSENFNKSISLLLIISILFINTYSLVTPKKAEGFAAPVLMAVMTPSTVLSVPTESFTQNTKEAAFDGIINLIGAALVAGIISSITNWVNSGFEDSPVFTQNIKQRLKKVGDIAAEQLLTQINIGEFNGGFFCGPFSSELRNAFKIKLAIQKDSTFLQSSRCSIDRILQEANYTLEGFEQDFTQGGWPAWIELTQPNNNRFGSYFITLQEFWKRSAEAEEQQDKELAHGSGFLSIKKKGECLKYENSVELQAPTSWDPNAPAGFDFSTVADEEGCIDRGPEQTVTPGQVIATQVNKVLGLGNDKLGLADEFDELVSALLYQVVNGVLTSVGGLFGASNPEPGEKSLTEQLKLEGERLDAQAEAKQEAQANQPPATQSPAMEELARLQEELNTCFDALNELNIILLKNDSVFNRLAVANQMEKCQAIQDKIEEVNLQAQVPTVPMTMTVYTCYDLLGGVSATKGVNMSVAGPITTTEEQDKGSYKVRITGVEPMKYYSRLRYEFDVTTGPEYTSLPGSANFTYFGRAKYPEAYDGWFNLGTVDGGTKFHWDMHSPDYYRKLSMAAPLQNNHKYHWVVDMDAKSNTLHVTITDGESEVRRVMFDYARSPAHPAPDIIDTGSGLYIMFGMHKGWTYRNLKVELTPGGPYQGGAHGCPVTV